MPLVLFEKDKEILRLSLNRTPALNAINSAVLQELENGLKDRLTDPDIRGLLLFGQGGCFASGADIRELSSLSEEGIRNFHRLRERTFALLENFPCPTIAVIQRYALGTGLELALCCAFRLAAADARLGIPSARLGLVESYEYFTRAVRAAGPAWTRRMVFTGDPVDADTALRIGLVEEVTRPNIFLSGPVITQTLLKKKAGGRIAAHEIMTGTTAVRNLIREGKIHQIPGTMQVSQKDGMQTMDMALQNLVSRGLVTREEAQSKSMNPNLFGAGPAAVAGGRL